MIDNNKILSICIPTRNRARTVVSTLNSIFSQDVSQELYEVLIYDSSEGNELAEAVSEHFSLPNLTYHKGENYGFLNLNEALKMGSGLYLKLHNDYSVLKPGALRLLIDQIDNLRQEKPLLLFSNGCLRDRVKKAYDFNFFLYQLSFFSTWSTIFGVWKSDFDLLDMMDVNPMFPHTSLLFQMNNKASFTINNSVLFENKGVANKGGYNLFKVFGITYLDMVKELLNREYIDIKTFQKVKKDLYYQFLIHWYSEAKVLRNTYTFSLTDIKKSVRTYYSTFDYYLLIVLGYLKAGLTIMKRTLKKVLNLK